MTERVRSAVEDGVSIRVIPRGIRNLKGLPAASVHAAVSP
jgi:hypothetical protein